MSTRPLISYDDITLPYDLPSNTDPSQPPAKKAKYNGGGGGEKGNNGHRNAQTGRVGFASTPQESRELSHEEIWDDSALIGAWDAALEEYEAFHGPGKDWKQEPVFKSPLWYNVPPKAKDSTSRSTPEEQQADIDAGDDDYDEDETAAEPTTYPTAQQHAFPYPGENYWPTGSPEAAAADLPNSAWMSMVSQDEAFSRASNAMYWGGYWTAMYHCKRNLALSSTNREATTDESKDTTQ